MDPLAAMNRTAFCRQLREENTQYGAQQARYAIPVT